MDQSRLCCVSSPHSQSLSAQLTRSRIFVSLSIPSLPPYSLPPSLFLPSLPIPSLPSSDLSFSIPLPRPLLLSLSIPTSIGALPYLLLSPISAIRQVGSFRLGDGKVRLRFHSQDPSPRARTCPHSLPKLLEIPGLDPCGKRNLQGEEEGTD